VTISDREFEMEVLLGLEYTVLILNAFSHIINVRIRVICFNFIRNVGINAGNTLFGFVNPLLSS
jgi:hypothetical protein